MSSSSFDASERPRFLNAGVAGTNLTADGGTVILGDTIHVKAFDTFCLVVDFDVPILAELGSFAVEAVPFDDDGQQLAPAIQLCTCDDKASGTYKAILVATRGTAPDVSGCTVGKPKLMLGFTMVRLQVHITEAYTGSSEAVLVGMTALVKGAR